MRNDEGKRAKKLINKKWINVCNDTEFFNNNKPYPFRKHPDKVYKTAHSFMVKPSQPKIGSSNVFILIKYPDKMSPVCCGDHRRKTMFTLNLFMSYVIPSAYFLCFGWCDSFVVYALLKKKSID